MKITIAIYIYISVHMHARLRGMIYVVVSYMHCHVDSASQSHMLVHAHRIILLYSKDPRINRGVRSMNIFGLMYSMIQTNWDLYRIDVVTLLVVQNL